MCRCSMATELVPATSDRPRHFPGDLSSRFTTPSEFVSARFGIGIGRAQRNNIPVNFIRFFSAALRDGSRVPDKHHKRRTGGLCGIELDSGCHIYHGSAYVNQPGQATPRGFRKGNPAISVRDSRRRQGACPSTNWCPARKLEALRVYPSSAELRRPGGIPSRNHRKPSSNTLERKSRSSHRYGYLRWVKWLAELRLQDRWIYRGRKLCD